MRQVSIFMQAKTYNLFLIALLLVSCTSSSHSIDLSPIVGDYSYSVAKNMGGFDISATWKLHITRNGPGDYSYTIEKTVTDEMYGGHPKTEEFSGKFSSKIDEKNDWYLLGYNNAHISIPYGGFDDAPSQIIMYGDGIPKIL